MRTTADQYVLGDDIAAIIFGVDGIVVDVDRAAAAAWKAVLDPFLRSYAVTQEAEFKPFEVRDDYLGHMHGKPRLDGVRAFLCSREITLPYDDLRGLAGREEELFLTEVRRYGIAPFTSTVRLLHAVRRSGRRTAAVSVDWYAAELLTRAGVTEMFDVRLDGLDAPGTRLPGHPEPGLFCEAALRLRTPPGRIAIVEQSLAGVSAARHGAFGLVVGVDRIGQAAAALREHGADVVINDLSEMRLPAGPTMAGRSRPYELIAQRAGPIEGTTPTNMSSTS
ncbi:HAD family hydrolase [Actinoallomurus sp. CA-150999]|uniref:HAD family hydrolase n=1 Tax=Actinoallomurus sp. CA-150999 TaxID=3239887 RepID=UPI003D8BC131